MRFTFVALLFGKLAHASLITLSGPGGTVPDNQPAGPGFVANAVTADGRMVTDVTLTLSGFDHTWIGDLIIAVRHVGVAQTTILNRLGSASNPIAACGAATLGCSSNLAGSTLGDYTFA